MQLSIDQRNACLYLCDKGPFLSVNITRFAAYTNSTDWCTNVWVVYVLKYNVNCDDTIEIKLH